jgi:hypothetical protein
VGGIIPDCQYNQGVRDHRLVTDRNLLLGFFVLLFGVGGGLIWLLYGGGAAALGVVCIALGAMLAGLVLFIMLALGWLSAWLDRRDLGD